MFNIFFFFLSLVNVCADKYYFIVENVRLLKKSQSLKVTVCVSKICIMQCFYFWVYFFRLRLTFDSFLYIRLAAISLHLMESFRFYCDICKLTIVSTATEKHKYSQTLQQQRNANWNGGSATNTATILF